MKLQHLLSLGYPNKKNQNNDLISPMGHETSDKPDDQQGNNISET